MSSLRLMRCTGGVRRQVATFLSRSTIARFASGGSSEYNEMYRQSVEHGEAFWGEHARTRLSWTKPFDTVSDCDLHSARISWFAGGQLNASHNCVDRHVEAGKGDETALIWERDEAGQEVYITFSEMQEQVCRLANVLKQKGVSKGDTVTLYMPMIPEAVYGMLACARIGAVHSVVFAGLSAEALRSRILDAQSRVVLTANEGLRGGKQIGLKKTVDEALAGVSLVETVLVARRTDSDVAMVSGRDSFLLDEMSAQSTECEIVPMESEDPLFLLYTSGSTGQPKGLVHSHAGYLLYTSLTHQYVFDYRAGDRYACVADVGWITGHSYLVYGPLVNGASTLLFESVPSYPTSSRYWEMVERLQLTQLYTSPTAIRSLLQHGRHFVDAHSRSSLRVLGTVGEPINHEAWQFYHDIVGEGRCTVVDTYWQSETGGHMLTPLPGDTDLQPGCATRPFFGVTPAILDDQGRELTENDVSGVLCFKHATPGMARTIWKDHGRFYETYFKAYPGHYFTGDGAKRDEKGHLWITGRVDDVINVSGHRLGTAEVEDALDEHASVAESAVVGVPHGVKGEAVFAYVVLKDGCAVAPSELKRVVRTAIGGYAQPERIVVCFALPKTRSGKIMRRILRKIAQGETHVKALGDLSTLAEPSVVQGLVDALTTDTGDKCFTCRA